MEHSSYSFRSVTLCVFMSMNLHILSPLLRPLITMWFSKHTCMYICMHVCVCVCARARVRVAAAVDDDVVLKAHQVVELRGFFIRHDFLPVALPHCGDRRLHELAVDTPAGVGDDEQLIPPVFDRVSVVLRPISVSKETYISVKRDLYQCSTEYRWSSDLRFRVQGSGFRVQGLGFSWCLG